MKTRAPELLTARGPSAGRFAVACVGGLALGLFAFCQVAGQTIARSRPAVGVALAPWDGTAAERLAVGLFRGHLANHPGTIEAPAGAVAVARRAFRKEPLVPSALALISTRLQEPKSAAFYAQASRLSRRDLLLQSLLLQHYAQSGQFPETIQTLNQVLQVHESERPVVFAQLITLLSDKRAVAALLQTLAERPAWGNAFLVAAARNGSALDNLAQLRRALPADYISPETDRVLINAFTAANRLDDAFMLYAQLPGKSHVGPGGWSSDVPPIDWALADSTGLRAQVEGDSPDLQVSVASGQGGVFAQRIMRAPRRPTLVLASYSEAEASTDHNLELTATCVPKSYLLGQTEFAGGRAALNLKPAPEDCKFVRIALSGRAWSEDQPILIRLLPVRIKSAE